MKGDNYQLSPNKITEPLEIKIGMKSNVNEITKFVKVFKDQPQGHVSLCG
jgi:hypothetical protein